MMARDIRGIHLNSDSATRASFMVFLVGSSLLWSLSFGLIKTQVADLDPIVVAAIRLCLSALAFAPLLRGFAPCLAVELMAIGAVQFGLMYCAYIASFRSLAAHQIALLTITTPIFVSLIDLGVNQRRSMAPIVAAIIAVIGGLVVVYNPKAFQPALAGLALMQISNLCFAAGQVWYRQVKARRRIKRDAAAFGWLYIGASLAPLAFLTWRGGPASMPATTAQWASLAYLGLIPSALGFFLWNKGVSRVTTGVAAAMNNLKIPGAVLLAWLLFGETINGRRLVASALLLGLALWIGRERRESRHPGLPSPTNEAPKTRERISNQGNASALAYNSTKRGCIVSST
ncbi:MAG: EamA family transporter [Vicinamibacteria bacterium]|nr:EamA family transporter [Vicinamibacteria bacterium]